jgi:hypothetical protein
MAKKKMGRPSKYSMPLARAICKRIAEGETPKSICSDVIEYEGGQATICVDTVNEWRDAHEEFSVMYARAKESYAYDMFREILDIADDARNDYMLREREGGGVYKNVDHEHINRSKLRVDARKWMLSKMLPRKYGDKITQEVELRTNPKTDAYSEIIAAAKKKIESG